MIWERQAETWPYGLEEGMLCGLTCVLQTWGHLGQESDLVTLLLGKICWVEELTWIKGEWLDIEDTQTTLEVLILIPFCRTDNETSGSLKTLT